jgi:hypothetical protein
VVSTRARRTARAAVEVPLRGVALPLMQPLALAVVCGVAVGQNLDRLHRLVLDELSEFELIDWSRGCIDSVGRGPTASQRRAWQALVAAFA